MSGEKEHDYEEEVVSLPTAPERDGIVVHGHLLLPEPFSDTEDDHAVRREVVTPSQRGMRRKFVDTPTERGSSLQERYLGHIIPGRPSPPSQRSMPGTNHWDRLPSHLTARILSLLPLSESLPSSRVCHTWRSLLRSSPPLSYLWDFAAPRRHLYLALHKPRSFAAFDLPSRRWITVPTFDRALPCPDNANALDPRPLDCPIASSGGLLCFLLSHNGQLIICNPLTGSWRLLSPPSPLAEVHAVGFAADHVSNSYVFMLLGETRSSSRDMINVITQVFDSTTGRWKEQCHFGHQYEQPPATQFERVGLVWHQGLFYYPVLRAGWLCFCDVREEGLRWGEIYVGMPQWGGREFNCPRLLSCGGKLILTGGLWEYSVEYLVDDDFQPWIAAWELERLEGGGFRWLMVASLTENELLSMLPEEFWSSSPECIGCGNLICYSWKRRWGSIITYDLTEKTWWRLPEDPAFIQENGFKLKKLSGWEFVAESWVGLHYEPNLFAEA